MNDPVQPRILFVTGAGHSGTTLLGMMLGTHQDALFAGEVQNCRFIGDEGVPLHRRVCRTCGEDCQIWNRVDTNKNVYDELIRLSGRPIIVDSSKKVRQWVRPASASLTGKKASLIFLTRDPRALVAAERRKRPGRSVAEAVMRWRGQMRRCETLAFDFPGPTIRVRYEELATRPAETLRTICAAIGLDFDERMLYPWSTVSHQLGGNMGVQSIASGDTTILSAEKIPYYAPHAKDIVLDERWKDELDEETLREIRSKAGTLFAAYAWNGYDNK